MLSSVDNILKNELAIRTNKKEIPNGTNTPFNLNNQEDINTYINTIISNLNIDNKIKHQQILIKLDNFKKSLQQFLNN